MRKKAQFHCLCSHDMFLMALGRHHYIYMCESCSRIALCGRYSGWIKWYLPLARIEEFGFSYTAGKVGG